MFINDSIVQLHKQSAVIYRSDTIELRGQVQVRVSAGGAGDGVTMQVGNVLRPQARPVLR